MVRDEDEQQKNLLAMAIIGCPACHSALTHANIPPKVLDRSLFIFMLDLHLCIYAANVVVLAELQYIPSIIQATGASKISLVILPIAIV